METQSQSQLPRPGDQAQSPSWRVVLLGVLILYGILFIFFNTGKIKINFVLFSANISTIFALLIMGAAGFAAGLFFKEFREKRKQQPPPPSSGL